MDQPQGVSAVFSNFVQNVHSEFPDYDVSYLLPDLEAQGVLTPVDSAAIRTKVYSAERMQLLFANIMPTRSSEKHWTLVKVLRRFSQERIACLLEDALTVLGPQPPCADGGQRHQASRSNTTGNASQVAPPNDFLRHRKSAYAEELGLLGQPADTRREMGEFPSTPAHRSAGLSLHALILSNETYTDGCERGGGSIDSTNMNRLLYAMGFQVSEGRNLKANEMLGAVHEFERSLVEVGEAHVAMIVVVVMSHYDSAGAFYGLDRELAPIDQLFRPLESRDYRKIPKFIFVQACRSAADLSSVPASDRSAGLHLIKRHEQRAMNSFFARIPLIDNMVIHVSVTPADYSWREKHRCSWFIQAVCTYFLNDRPVSNDVRRTVAKAFVKQRDFLTMPCLMIMADSSEMSLLDQRQPPPATGMRRVHSDMTGERDRRDEEPELGSNQRRSQRHTGNSNTAGGRRAGNQSADEPEGAYGPCGSASEDDDPQSIDEDQMDRALQHVRAQIRDMEHGETLADDLVATLGKVRRKFDE